MPFYSSSNSEVDPGLSVGTRLSILFQDRGRCVYCGLSLTDRTMTIDHVVPTSKGGALRLRENLVSSCASCNRNKGDKLVTEIKIPHEHLIRRAILQRIGRRDSLDPETIVDECRLRRIVAGRLSVVETIRRMKFDR